MPLTLRDAAEITRPLGLARDPELRWREFDDLSPLRGELAVGYSVEWDGNVCRPWLHRAVLHATDAPDVEVPMQHLDVEWLEREIASLEEIEAEAVCDMLADDDDRGDWELEARRDRESLR